MQEGDSYFDRFPDAFSLWQERFVKFLTVFLFVLGPLLWFLTLPLSSGSEQTAFGTPIEAISTQVRGYALLGGMFLIFVSGAMAFLLLGPDEETRKERESRRGQGPLFDRKPRNTLDQEDGDDELPVPNQAYPHQTSGDGENLPLPARSFPDEPVLEVVEE